MLCKREYKAIKDHKCPVHTICTVSPHDLFRDIIMVTNDGPTAICDGCGVQHFLTKYVHGFRRYKNVDLCADCYEIPEIQQATSTEWVRLDMMDIQLGKTVCAVCAARLAIGTMGATGAQFRRERVDVLDKQSTVYQLVVAGAPNVSIRAANVRSHNLCLRCHSAFCISKKFIDIHRLRTLQVSNYTKKMAQEKVETLVYLLVFRKFENSYVVA
jgi:hypothetical protein